MKTKDLTGAALDWAVAKAIGWTAERPQDGQFIDHYGRSWLAGYYGVSTLSAYTFNPSSEWAHGGPLIEKYEVIYRHHVSCVEACCMTGEIGVNRKRAAPMKGSTLLEAACRSIVKLKLGSDVEIPKEFL